MDFLETMELWVPSTYQNTKHPTHSQLTAYSANSLRKIDDFMVTSNVDVEDHSCYSLETFDMHNEKPDHIPYRMIAQLLEITIKQFNKN